MRCTTRAAAGDGGACDELFITSEPDTEYERFGLTCGDRFPPSDLPEACVDAI